MRVGIEAWGLSGDMRNTGMVEYTAQLLIGLARHALKVQIFAYGGPREPRPEWLPINIRWRKIGRRLPYKFSALASRWLPLNRRLEADGIDVFHCASVHWRPQFPQVPRPACPVVVTLHDLIIQTYYDPRTLPFRQRTFAKWNLARALRADRVVTVSEHSKSEIVRYTGCDPEHVRVIHNSIEFAPCRDRGVLSEFGIRPPYVLFAGSYEPRKNLVGAGIAFAQLMAEGMPHQFVAVVERNSGHAPAVIEQLQQAGIGDRIRLVHSLPPEKLRALYTFADALLFPSLAEGFGYPPLQAAACGLPSVVSDLEPLHETLGGWPIFADPRNPTEIAAGLRRVLTDESIRADMARRGPALAASFNPDRNIAEHLETYFEVRDRHQAVATVA